MKLKITVNFCTVIFLHLMFNERKYLKFALTFCVKKVENTNRTTNYFAVISEKLSNSERSSSGVA